MTKPTQDAGRALIYIRRSDDGQEASLSQQLEWARATATKVGVPFRGTVADIQEMQRKRLHHFHDIYMDDAISGGDMNRPGFLKFLRDAQADRSVTHVYVFKRDRLARPQDVLRMLVLERDLIVSGVTLVTHDYTYTPEEVKANEEAYIIRGFLEYREHGKFSPRLGDRIVFVQRMMASKGFSTGGRAPFGHARALIKPDGSFAQWLEDGETIRREGHHVKFIEKDDDKINIWKMILYWREDGDSYKRIAKRLNELGISSPDAGRQRRDHGSRHSVPGKWHPNTVRDLCTNPIIAGIKEYGKRSEGRYRRVGVDGPRELNDADRHPDGKPKLLENPIDVRVRAKSSDDAPFDFERWQALQPKGITIEEGRRIGGRKPNNPDRYPLSTRVIDLTDGCGSVMHGRKSGERLTYECGRYTNSGCTECNHNAVDANAVSQLVLDALIELIAKAGGRDAIRLRLLAKARAEAAGEMAEAENPVLSHLRNRLGELDGEIATAQRRMATEKDDNRYEAIAAAFDGLVAERADAARRIAELAVPKPVTPVDVSPEAQVDAIMATIDEIGALAADDEGRKKIRALVLRLGIFIGLDFEAGKFGKREVRRLRRGVIAFGENNLPVPIHGRSRIDLPPPDAANDGSITNTHSALACCQGPTAEPGSFGGDGTENNRPDESTSEVEQTHTVSNVGATGLEPATS